MNQNGEPTSGEISNVNGDLDISEDLTVNGNLTVNGTTTTVNTETLVIEDPLVKFGLNNSANLQDGGFIIEYTSLGTKYSGLIRDKSDSNVFKLVEGLSAEPTLTSNNTATYDSALGALEVSTLTATGKIQSSNFGDDASNNLFIGNINDPAPSGTDNIMVGRGAGNAITDGSQNVYVGLSAGSLTTTGGGNTGIGQGCLQYITTGTINSCVGSRSGIGLGPSSTGNVALGNNSLGGNSSGATGNYNVAIGSQALYNIDSGNHNTSVGYLSGHGLTTGSRNVLLGYRAGDDLTTEDDKFRIESNTNLLIDGDFSTGVVKLTDLDSGTWTPTITFSTTGTLTETTQTGTWDLVGKTYFFQIRIVWSGHSGTAPSGNASINLPFTPTNSDNASANIQYVNGIGFSTGYCCKVSGANILPYNVTSLTTTPQMDNSNFPNNAGEIMLNGRLRIA